MLTKKQIRLLELLDKQVALCERCALKENGCAIPFWTPKSKYAIIGEAPGQAEIRRKIPFVGQAGKILTECLVKENFDPEEFLIINTVQCRPIWGTNQNRNGKPTESQILHCQPFLRKYLKVLRPDKILCLGNYAKYYFTRSTMGILRVRGTFVEYPIDSEFAPDDKFPVMLTVHPAYCIYNEEGKVMLRQDLKIFKETEFERKSTWFLLEEDFMV